jgi:hypothetical protein
LLKFKISKFQNILNFSENSKFQNFFKKFKIFIRFQNVHKIQFQGRYGNRHEIIYTYYCFTLKIHNDLISAPVSARGLRTDTQSWQYQPYRLHHIIMKYMINCFILQSVHLLYKYAIRINFCFIRSMRITF